MPADDADDVARLAADLRLTLGRLVRRARAESTLLPVGQTAVLGRLDREGPMTTSDLAAAERVRPQSMARTVALLQQERFIAAEPHPTDGRKTLLRIAPQGLETLAAQRQGREDWLAEALADELGVADRRAVRKAVALLDRLTDHGPADRNFRPICESRPAMPRFRSAAAIALSAALARAPRPRRRRLRAPPKLAGVRCVPATAPSCRAGVAVRVGAPGPAARHAPEARACASRSAGRAARSPRKLHRGAAGWVARVPAGRRGRAASA